MDEAPRWTVAVQRGRHTRTGFRDAVHHHQLQQGGERLQRLPASEGVPQLHAQLQDDQIHRDVRQEVRPRQVRMVVLIFEVFVWLQNNLATIVTQRRVLTWLLKMLNKSNDCQSNFGTCVLKKKSNENQLCIFLCLFDDVSN